MKKRIIIRTQNGFKLYGDCYESDNNSPKFDICSNNTKQDLKEYVKAANKYRVNNYELDYWEVQVLS